VGNDLFRAHEETMKGYDAHLSSTLGLAESDELIMEELEELLRTAADLSAELVSAQNSRLHHQNSMRVIELTPGASDGVVKALRRRTKRSLPFEEEYREHRESLAKIEKRVEACGRKLERVQRDEAVLRQKTPGIFEHAFLDYQQSKSLHKAAFHNQNLVGNDIHAVFQPGAIEGFTALMRPALQTVCKPSGVPDRPVQFGVGGAGSNKDADRTKKLWESFSAVKTIYSRVEPLCDHQRYEYRAKLIPRFATLYNELYPEKPPTPKLCAVRIFDTASQGSSPGSSVHPRGALLLATTKPQAPSASMRTALDATSIATNVQNMHPRPQCTQRAQGRKPHHKQ
jgi:hypothetical protein